MTDVDEFKQKKKEFKANAKEIADELDKCEYITDTGTLNIPYYCINN